MHPVCKYAVGIQSPVVLALPSVAHLLKPEKMSLSKTFVGVGGRRTQAQPIFQKLSLNPTPSRAFCV